MSFFSDVRDMFGDFWAAGRDQIRHQYARFFEAKNILILGPKQAGKTSLIWLLEKGKPYRKSGQRPNPTAMAAIIDKKMSRQTANWLKVQKDLPGDEGLREQWLSAINELEPEGIIYVIDGREELFPQLDILFSDVIGKANGQATEVLRVLHVFVNFSDLWAQKPLQIRKRVREVEDLLFADMSELGYDHVFMQVHHTHLNPRATAWPEAETALQAFSTDLGED